jgi:hypothetical protein
LVTVEIDRNSVPLICSIIAISIANPRFWATISVAIFDFAYWATTTATTIGAVATVTFKFVTVEINRNTIPFVGAVITVAIRYPIVRTTVAIAVFDFTCWTTAAAAGISTAR